MQHRNTTQVAEAPTHILIQVTHIVGSLHLLEVGPVLLRYLLPPLVELVRVHLERLIPVGSLDLRRRRPLVHVQQRVELISVLWQPGREEEGASEVDQGQEGQERGV